MEMVVPPNLANALADVGVRAAPQDPLAATDDTGVSHATDDQRTAGVGALAAQLAEVTDAIPIEQVAVLNEVFETTIIQDSIARNNALYTLAQREHDEEISAGVGAPATNLVLRTKSNLTSNTR